MGQVPKGLHEGPRPPWVIEAAAESGGMTTKMRGPSGRISWESTEKASPTAALRPRMTISRQAVLDFLASLPGLDTMRDAHGDFFFYDPQRDTPHDKRQPFATVMDADAYGPAPILPRPDVYRLNVGVARETYRALFGPEPAWGKDGGPVETGHDFSLLDTFLPHPVYAPLGWICILDPSEANWPRAQAYVREAHALARDRHGRGLRSRGAG